MEDDDAMVRLSALAAPSRLAVVRALAEAPDGMASGVLAKRLDVPPNTLSTQLLLLSNARLVRSRRQGRTVIYTLRPEAKQELTDFLDAIWRGTKAPSMKAAS